MIFFFIIGIAYVGFFEKFTKFLLLCQYDDLSDGDKDLLEKYSAMPIPIRYKYQGDRIVINHEVDQEGVEKFRYRDFVCCSVVGFLENVKFFVWTAIQGCT